MFFFNLVVDFAGAKFIYVNLIYTNVLVAHNNTNKLCVQQQQCMCMV